MNAMLQEDTEARARALEPASFIVEAPAGAGKTELLTQRTLRLLALVEHPEEVVALTFTNKAATEMRDRILGSLNLAASGQRPGDEAPHRQLTFDLGRAVLARDQERGWQLLQHPGRLVVTTLDALCGSLARQMPLLSRFGAQPGIAEDAEEHYRNAARRTLAMLEEEGPASAVIAAALDHVDNHHGQLENLLIQMLSRRDQWLQHTSRTDAELRAEAEAGLAALAQRDLAAAATHISGRWQSEVMAAVRFAANTLLLENQGTPLAPLQDWATSLTSDPNDLLRWRALAELLLTDKGTLRKRLDVRIGFPPTPEGKPHKAVMQAAIDSLGSDAEAALQALRDLPSPLYDDATWSGVETFSHLLNLAAAQLWLSFQEAGVVDFGEITHRALLALGSDQAPTDLALALDYRLRHLLVDEFQDTSPTQVRLIAGLTRGWQGGGKSDDGRTLFLVGDPMQSIYRFRKADVGLFLKVRENGIGSVRPEKLRLYRNNRSRPAIVDWINAEFPSIFPANDDPLAGAVRYAPSAATREADADAGVHMHPLFDTSDSARSEARQMLAIIHQTQRERPDGSIAILVRARSHLDALVAVIRHEAPALHFQAVETESLAGRQAIQDVLSLAHAMLHRGDRVHWLAILRAPWCGLTLADLHALAADDHQSTLWSLLQQPERLVRLSADGQARLQPLIATLSTAFANIGRQHPRRWIEGVWRQLGGPQCLQEASDHEALDTLFKLMDELAAGRRFTADTLASKAAELFSPPDPTPAASRVQMMTIHKSKGLEFDTVLLPGLHRDGGKDTKPLLVWDEIPASDGTEEYLIAAPLPRKSERNSGEAASIYEYLRRQERERSRHESKRLLYVAATRARHSLHLFGTLNNKEDELKNPGADTLLGLLWQGEVRRTTETAFASAGLAPDGAPTMDSSSFVASLLRLPTASIATTAANPSISSATNTQSFSNHEADSSHSLDAAVGTLVHRCLEIIAREGIVAWPAERIANITPAYRQWLRSQGHAADQAKIGAVRVSAALQGMLAAESGRWVLSAHEQSAVELALSNDGEAGPQHHVVDRTFISDGARWIVDYKTVSGLRIEDIAVLQKRAEEYRDQLERYAALFAKEGRPIRLAIYFVEQARLVELHTA